MDGDRKLNLQLVELEVWSLQLVGLVGVRYGSLTLLSMKSHSPFTAGPSTPPPIFNQFDQEK